MASFSSPSICFFFVLILASSPGKIGAVSNTGDDLVRSGAPEGVNVTSDPTVIMSEDGSNVLDYSYQCSSNLGPCNTNWCDENCCKRACWNDYSGLHPHPTCVDIPGYQVRLCRCWHDCYWGPPALS